MRLIFCVREHTFDEIQMGHLLGFPAILGLDAISATANARGFTPLTAIARTYGWQREQLEAASAQCNHRQEVAVIKALSPTLLLVPRTHGDEGRLPNVDILIADLLAAVSHLKVRSLHFTHFGFVQGRFPEMEVRTILETLLGSLHQSSLDVLYWDIDRRVLNDMIKLYSRVSSRYQLKPTGPEIDMAPQFTWHPVATTPDGHSLHVFADARETATGSPH
jgi:hypothetical protein